MLWSQLEGKEIINLRDGERIGRMADADLIVDPEDGTIIAMIVHAGWKWLGGQGDIEIPWQAVRRIGSELVIVDLDLSAPSRPY